MALAAAAVLSLSAFSAHAQQTATAAASPVDCKADPSDPNCQLEEVVVTGSLIRRPASETTEAITILKADTLKDLGVENVEQALDMLTSNNPTVNIASAVGTFSGGGTYANLRGLGSSRTLVLLDGQRLAPNAFNGNAVDLSGIPFSSIDSIEVLREGASALYGSDAIAGVINFITKKNYQGADFSVSFDKPQSSGGDSDQMEFSFGHGDLKTDGYNFLVTASYSHQDDLTALQRGFTREGFYPGLGWSSTNDPGTWPGSVTYVNPFGLNPAPADTGNFYQFGGLNCPGNVQLTTYFGNCAYRYSAATDLIPESQEVSGMAAFTKALPGNNQVQLQYFWTRSQLDGWSGPMFYFFELNPASPYYPTAGQLNCIAAYSGNCSVPPSLNNPNDPAFAVWSDPDNNRYAGNINTEQRALLTFSGNNSGWDYSTSLNYSQNFNDDRNTGGYPNEAILAPGGVLSTLINPFGAQTAAGQALINSSYLNGVYEWGEDKRWSFDGHASHALADVFNAGTPETLAFGWDVGGENFQNATTNYNTIIQAATGLTNSAVEGSRQTQALFAELDVPLAKTLDLDISDREDRYSDFGTTNNWKVALRHQPTSYLTFRATASTGFKAPTLAELYSPDSLAASSSGTMGQGNPICEGEAASGVYNSTEWPQSVCNTQGLGLYGGNRGLTPETSENFDFGVIYSPVEDLGITADFYRIIVKNLIGGIPESTIYGNPTEFANYIHTNAAGTLTPSVEESNQCAAVGGAAPQANPNCGYILLTDSNTGLLTTDGIDISVDYLQRTSIGTFHEDLEGTWTTQFELEQYTGGPLLNLVGWYNQNPPAFRWQHNLMLTWTSPQGMWGADLNNRFYTGYIDEFPNGAGNARMVASYSLWNAAVSLKPMDRLSVLFGIKNLLNTVPPFTNASQNNFAAGYNVLVGDPLLRNFYVNVKYKLF